MKKSDKHIAPYAAIQYSSTSVLRCKCLHPVQCWQIGHAISKDGLKSPRLTFSYKEAFDYYSRLGNPFLVDRHAISLPCGKCAICQIRKRKDMSVRLIHEASLYDNMCFITLTYDEENCPITNGVEFDRCLADVDKEHGFERTLLPRDVQLFLKRLRRHLEYVPKRPCKDVRDHVEKPIRYFAVGEYGSRTHRPHYHIIIFGWCPSDAALLKVHNGRPVYRSSQIEKLWKYGFSSFSDVTPAVAKYCARYVTKKYARLDDDKFVGPALPEFVLQSIRNGGIGAPWFDKFGIDACLRGHTSIKLGNRVSICKIPKYYWFRLRKKWLMIYHECKTSQLIWLLSHRSSGIHYGALVREAMCSNEETLYYASKEYF